jgi:integrase
MNVPHVPMLKERNVRTGFFEREQIERVLAHLPPAIRPAVQFACITGWRIPSEVLKLQWRHVDFEARVVRLDPHTTKNDEGRTFPFTDALARLLEAQKAEHERLNATSSRPRRSSMSCNLLLFRLKPEATLQTTTGLPRRSGVAAKAGTIRAQWSPIAVPA